MKFRIVLILLIFFSTCGAAGFEDSFLWNNSIKRPSADSFQRDNNSLKSVYFHSNIYGVEGLNWNYVSIEYDKATWGIALYYNLIGYRQYYRRNSYNISANIYPGKSMSIKSSLAIYIEKFQDNGIFTELSGGVGFGYTKKKYNLETGIAEIDLKKPYPDKAPGEKYRPFVSGSWIFNDGLTLTVGIRRFENRRTRWIFDQYVAVNEKIGLNFGYKNNPSNIYGGIELTIKKISIIINYCSVSELTDSIVWGVSFRK